MPLHENLFRAFTGLDTTHSLTTLCAPWLVRNDFPFIPSLRHILDRYNTWNMENAHSSINYLPGSKYIALGVLYSLSTVRTVIELTRKPNFSVADL